MSRFLRWAAAGAAVASAAGVATSIVLARMIDAVPVATPAVSGVPLESIFPPRRSVAFTITADWIKVPFRADVERVAADDDLWRRMHFDDWDRVPLPLRERGLRNMVEEYGDLIDAPPVWDGMDAADWDVVPQPIRALAFIRMMQYWSGYYQVGATYDLPRGLVADTLSAILMVESWWEHRAVSVSRSGNRDLGLGQMSDYARATLLRFRRQSIIDFSPEDDAGYFDPWQATRMTALWFDLMLDEQGGDLDAAVRAYHRGTPLAMTPEGEAYLTNVRMKRRHFIRNIDSTPAWDLLMRLGATVAPVRS